MTQPIARDPMYRKRIFDAQVLELCVRWYVTYRLSYRDLVAIMAERGVKVAHTTVLLTSGLGDVSAESRELQSARATNAMVRPPYNEEAGPRFRRSRLSSKA